MGVRQVSKINYLEAQSGDAMQKKLGGKKSRMSVLPDTHTHPFLRKRRGFF